MDDKTPLNITNDTNVSNLFNPISGIPIIVKDEINKIKLAII
jgi:hypothetical protein